MPTLTAISTAASATSGNGRSKVPAALASTVVSASVPTRPIGLSRNAKASAESVISSSGFQAQPSAALARAQQRRDGERAAERDQQRADRARKVARAHVAGAAEIEIAARATGRRGRTR